MIQSVIRFEKPNDSATSYAGVRGVDRHLFMLETLVVTLAGDRVHDDVNNHIDSVFRPVHHRSHWSRCRWRRRRLLLRVLQTETS